MFITKVELENIKSYRHATIELRRGTTAIRGANGAGKTTLVEAIGFALFNHLPYSQAQFVREGERSGQVTVSFIGPDERLYQVVRRCGTPSAWYVYDPQLDKRLVDQSADVVDWLREHLPLQGEIKLEAFFSDALGVQQGTFTSDFLATSTNRKRKFDALLQIEDYRRAYEKLRDTGTYLLDEKKELDVCIAALERETQGIESLVEKLAQLRKEQDVCTEQLLVAQAERDQAEQRRDYLRRLKDDVKDLESRRALAESGWQQTQATLEQAQFELKEVEAAHCKVAETTEDHTCFVQTVAALGLAWQQQREQQSLLVTQNQYNNELAEARKDAEHAEANLAKAEAAGRRVTELKPLVEQQTALEQEIATASDQARRLLTIKQEIERLETERGQLTTQFDNLAQHIASIERQWAEAALLSERRAAIDSLNLEVQRHADWADQLSQARKDLEEIEPQRKDAEADLQKAQADVTKLRDRQGDAKRLPELEAAFSALNEQVVSLRTNIKRHNESKLQSVGGQCPFLKEPCLNIRQKGQASLESYFDGLIARDQKALAPLEAEWKTLEKQVQEFRVVKQFVDRLPEYEGFLRRAQKRQAEIGREAKRLAERKRELETLLIGPGDHDRRLAEAQRLLQRSTEADKQVSRLDDLAHQSESLRGQLDANVRQREALEAERAGLIDAPARGEAAAQKLQALGDPRREYLQQESLALQEAEYKAGLKMARQAMSQAEKKIAALAVELAPYAGLDAHIIDLRRQQEQSRNGYQIYLANEQMAGKLPERQSAFASAQAAEFQAQKRYAAAKQRYAEVVKDFSVQALEAAEVGFVRLANLVVELGGALHRIREDSERVAQQISEAEGKKAELEAARTEQQELIESREMLQQFRETIRDAGPYVMKELLRQISHGANRIFGEILGDRSVELSWEEDYEIVLRSRGQTRTFAQLSGGEQMSAALAVRLALLKTLAQIDVAFFDEPTQSMDDLRRGNLAEQIKRVRGFNQLIVISHDDTFEQSLDSMIYLQKRDGETIIVGAGDLEAEDLALVGSGIEDGL